MLELLIWVAVFWVLAFLFVGIFRIYRAVWLVFKGRYESAIQCLDRLLHQKRLSKGHRSVCVYNKAICQHRTGKYEDSIATLGQIDRERLGSKLGAAFDGLHAANLLQLESDLLTARHYLEKAAAQTQLSSYALLLGYCESLLGNQRRADELVASFLEKTQKHKKVSFGFPAILVTDKVFENCTSHFILGQYCLRKAERALANQHFIQAADCRIANIYSAKAKDVLKTINC
jgi:tetratricopeptide (TPR) repeat protein